MTNWLESPIEPEAFVVPLDLLGRITLAFGLGCLVALIYKGTHRSEPMSPTFPRTLILLSILIAMVTSVIGNNVARAFSLVGALSIVRFRTVVRDTQDTAFVIFAVVVGMAAGADHLWVAVIGSGVVAAAVFIVRPRGASTVWTEEECDLSVRFNSGANPEQLVGPAFKQHLLQHEVLGVSTAKQGTAIEVMYRIRFQESSAPLLLVRELSVVEGIQNVEVHRED